MAIVAIRQNKESKINCFEIFYLGWPGRPDEKRSQGSKDNAVPITAVKTAIDKLIKKTTDE